MRLDHLIAQAGLPQRGPQPGHQGLQRVAGVGRRLLFPEPFDQRVGGHDLARVERQQDHQQAHPVPADLYRPAGLVVHREGAQ